MAGVDTNQDVLSEGAQRAAEVDLIATPALKALSIPTIGTRTQSIRNAQSTTRPAANLAASKATTTAQTVSYNTGSIYAAPMSMPTSQLHKSSSSSTPTQQTPVVIQVISVIPQTITAPPATPAAAYSQATMAAIPPTMTSTQFNPNAIPFVVPTTTGLVSPAGSIVASPGQVAKLPVQTGQRSSAERSEISVTAMAIICVIIMIGYLLL